VRAGCRELGLGYVVAVRADHRVTLLSEKAAAVTDALALLPQDTWQRCAHCEPAVDFLIVGQ
jgi:hypothetical protein